jgi:hypothetical protein
MVMMFVGGVVLMLDGFLELLGVKLFNTDAWEWHKMCEYDTNRR